MERPITSILETQQEQNQYFKDNYTNSFQRTMMLAADIRRRIQAESAERDRLKRLRRYDIKHSDPVQIRRIVIQ